jgi:hypothetical protein
LIITLTSPRQIRNSTKKPWLQRVWCQCKYTWLNQLIKDHRGPGKLPGKPSWYMKGTEKIMDANELVRAKSEQMTRVW